MAKVRDYHKLALDIIDVVGGQKNIANATEMRDTTPSGIKRDTRRSKRKSIGTGRSYHSCRE